MLLSPDVLLSRTWWDLHHHQNLPKPCFYKLQELLKSYLAFCFYWLDERWTSHRLDFNDVVVKKNLNIINCRHCAGILKEKTWVDETARRTFGEARVTTLELLRTWKAVCVCVTYGVSVLIEGEAEISPFILHLPHVGLQRVFFAGQCANLFQSIAKEKLWIPSPSVQWCLDLILYFYCRSLDLLVSKIRKSCLQHIKQWRGRGRFDFSAHNSADLQVENTISDKWATEVLVRSNLMRKNYFGSPAASGDLWFHGCWWFWGRGGAPWIVLPFVRKFWPQSEAQEGCWKPWRAYAGFSTCRLIHQRLPQLPNPWKDLWVKWWGGKIVIQAPFRITM